MHFGLQTLAPKFFKNTRGKPVLAVAGFNVGLNTGPTTLISGTVGATTAASLAGIPAIAFSGASGTQISYVDPPSNATYAQVYAELSARFTHQLLEGARADVLLGGRILPQNIWINVNFSPSPSTTNSGACTKSASYKYIFTRINNSTTPGSDLNICGNRGTLQTENEIMAKEGCWVTVSVGEAVGKMDVDKDVQRGVYEKVVGLLSCV